MLKAWIRRVMMEKSEDRPKRFQRCLKLAMGLAMSGDLERYDLMHFVNEAGRITFNSDWSVAGSIWILICATNGVIGNKVS